jgi:hypothetical protein
MVMRKGKMSIRLGLPGAMLAIPSNDLLKNSSGGRRAKLHYHGHSAND